MFRIIVTPIDPKSMIATKEMVKMIMILFSSGKVELFKNGRLVVLAGELPNFQSVVAFIVDSSGETSRVTISSVDAFVSIVAWTISGFFVTPDKFVCGFVGNLSSGVVVSSSSVVCSSSVFFVVPGLIVLEIFLVVRGALVVLGVKGRGLRLKKCLLVVAGVEFGNVSGPFVVVSSVRTRFPPKNSNIFDLYS